MGKVERKPTSTLYFDPKLNTFEKFLKTVSTKIAEISVFSLFLVSQLLRVHFSVFSTGVIVLKILEVSKVTHKPHTRKIFKKSP
jgi:hypothetical protein